MGVLPEKVVKKCLWATGRLDPLLKRGKSNAPHYVFILPRHSSDTPSKVGQQCHFNSADILICVFPVPRRFPLSLRTASHAVWQSHFFFHHNVGIEHLPIRAARFGKRALQLMSSVGGGGPNAPEVETFSNCQTFPLLSLRPASIAYQQKSFNQKAFMLNRHNIYRQKRNLYIKHRRYKF